MHHTRVSFPNLEGIELSAALDTPDQTRAVALFAHCFTCTKNLSAVRRIARGLVDEDIAVLSFDFTGLGESDGEFADSTFASQTGDLVAAAKYLESELGAGPSILVGHSLGGTAALYAAKLIDSVEAVSTIGAPADPGHALRLFEERVEEIEQDGEAQVTIGGRPFRIKRKLIDDLRDHPPASWLPSLRKRVLIFHSPIDETVDISNAADIYTALKHPKSFVSLDRADHLLSRKEDARHVARVLAAWTDSFLPRESAFPALDTPDRESKTIDLPSESSAAPSFVEPGDDYTVAVRMGSDHYPVALSNGRHHQLSDEPESVGGGDSGGNPFDYLLWGLAACTVMTVRMYADRKEWPVGEIRARLRLQKVKAEDAGFSPELAEHSKGMATVIEVALEIEGDLNEKQRVRLLEIAQRCPVHRTLIGPVRVEYAPAPVD